MRNLADMVRGLRAHKKDETQFISQCLAEIKQELRSTDRDVKAVAVQKLSYVRQFPCCVHCVLISFQLQMFGYDTAWAAFQVIEVMSSTKFTHKRIGYLAASQSFSEGTDVLMLATQLIRKVRSLHAFTTTPTFLQDITSSNQWEAGVAINALANVCTTDLARDLAADVVSMLNSSRPYIRKKVLRSPSIACLTVHRPA